MNNTNRMTKIILLAALIVILLFSVVLFPALFFSRSVAAEMNQRQEEELVSIANCYVSDINLHFTNLVKESESVAAMLANNYDGKLFKEEDVIGSLIEHNNLEIAFDPFSTDENATKLVIPKDEVAANINDYAENRSIRQAYLVSNQGYYHIADYNGVEHAIVDLHSNEIFTSPMTNNALLCFKPLSTVTDYSYSVSVPVKHNEQVIAVLVLCFDGTDLTDILKLYNNSDAFCTLLGEDKRVLASSSTDAPIDVAIEKSATVEAKKSYIYTASDKEYCGLGTELTSTALSFEESLGLLLSLDNSSYRAHKSTILTTIGLIAVISFVGFALPIGVLLVIVIIHVKRDKTNLVRYRTILNVFKKYTFTYDKAQDALSFSDVTKKLFGLSKNDYTFKEMLDKKCFPQSFYDEAIKELPNLSYENQLHFQFYCDKIDRYMAVSLSMVPQDRETLVKDMHIVGMIEDVTDEVLSKQALEELSKTDSLTKLYNRDSMKAAVDEFITENKGQRQALYIVDIDGFKQINDTYGHMAGDTLLQSVARSLESAFDKDKAIVGRISSDVFCVFVKFVATNPEVSRIAKKICDRISSISISENSDFYLSCSVGASIYPKHASTFLDLYQRADNALYKSKEFIGSVYTIYDSVDTIAVENLDEAPKDEQLVEDNFSLLLSTDNDGFDKLKALLITAMDNNEFVIYTQPKVSSQPRIGMQAEALARWFSPTYGKIMPNKFIPLLEKTNLIEQFDLYILRQAFIDIANRIKTKTKYVIPLSVNQSLQTIVHPYYIVEVMRYISDYKIPTNLITIEITERGLFTNIRTLIKILNKLHELGFPVSIDDFGSGFTTLSILKDLVIDEIKIDKSFADRNNANSEKAKIVIKQIIEMAKKLDIVTVAEGVEYKEQAKYLAEFGCDFLQGFYVGKPMPIDEMYDKFHLGIFNINTLI